MTTQLEQNTEVHLATQFALYTSHNLFVSGKAGTGKTTFLRSIKKNTNKKMAIAAPTGIAAINAGGVTLHSLFQLPIGAFTPSPTTPSDLSSVFTKDTMLRNMRMGDEKRRLIRELELLVIDEVSMLRCDAMDAIDVILRQVRQRKHLPFGGLQVLFIGDLQQLPPVIGQQEWQHLSQYYESPFFFSSKVYQSLNVQHIEFTKIYRQRDEDFISLLEQVRRNALSPEAVKQLNSRYQPGVAREKGVITLTTHNQKADLINEQELKGLHTKEFCYVGELSGDFNDRNAPAPLHLKLREGAQVMFVRNDSSAEKRYFNGKMAIVKSLSDEEIEVECIDDRSSITVGQESWKNVRYNHNLEKDKVEEEETGCYTQYPLKLAWAITIHKSQGLTFDKVQIDAAEAFAGGQVYVALSRCRSLEGITLTSAIGNGAIQVDTRLNDFPANEKSEDQLAEDLEVAKLQYARKQLVKAFTFTREAAVFEEFITYTEERKFADKEMVLAVFKEVLNRVVKLEEVASKFTVQLESYFASNEQDTDWLEERIGKSIQYFVPAWHKEVIEVIESIYKSIKPKKGVKQFVAELAVVLERCWTKFKQLQSLEYQNFDLNNYKSELNVLKREEVVIAEKQKAQKGETFLETLKLFKSGKTMEEIAGIRGMVISTIEGHIARYVTSGEINVFDVLSQEKFDTIRNTMQRINSNASKVVKDALGPSFSYGEIKLVQAHLQKAAAEQEAKA